MEYKATTDQDVTMDFDTGKGDIYAVYLATKWAVKNGYDLLEVVRLGINNNYSVIFDNDY
jgi:hypothetical protein